MDTPETDYPAAHSMDTEWYAVDRDGHVGVFESGEAGAVPDGAHTEKDTHRSDLALLLPDAPYRLLDWLGDDRQEHHVELPHRNRADGLGPTLLFLGSIEPVRAESDRYLLAEAPAVEGVAVFFDDLPTATAWRLHEAGACLGCFAWPGEGSRWDFHLDLTSRMGLFHYDHDEKAENWISASYLRKQIPSRPLRIEQVPAEIREAIGRVRFADLRFTEAEKIQPVTRLPCQSWQSAYLDPDGVTIRPFPGREADFDPAQWARVPGFRVGHAQPPP